MLKGVYIGDYIGKYYGGYERGILGVKATAHIEWSEKPTDEGAQANHFVLWHGQQRLEDDCQDSPSLPNNAYTKIIPSTLIPS